jgi:hypothetical protein
MLGEKDIFTDGEIVENFTIPEEFRDNTYDKKKWGEEALRAYVSQFFGTKGEFIVTPSRSHNGSLTGTQAIITKGDIKTTYMLVEPKGKFRNEVHVSRLVESLEEGGFLDVIDYRFRGDGRKAQDTLDNPFAALAGIKDNLPAKRKNSGAPKRKSFRW